MATTRTPEHTAAAERLLAAHTRFMLRRLTGDGRDDLVSALVEELLEVGEHLTVAQVVEVDTLVASVRRLLLTVPPSDAATALSQRAAEVLHEGPTEPFAPADLVSRDDVRRLIGLAVRSEPVVRRTLDEVVQSPLVATIAARFVGRVVADAMAANKAVAEKLPGIGGLVSFGAGTATRLGSRVASGVGVDQLIGDATGKGAQLAARRVARLVADTLKDPQLEDALLQLWDDTSTRQVHGLTRVADLDDVHEVVVVVHDALVGLQGSAPYADLVERLIRAAVELYADTPVTTALAELGVERDPIVADLTVAAGTLLDAAAADGHLEALVRTRLEPFYLSDAFVEALDG